MKTTLSIFFQVSSCLTPTQQSTLWSTLTASQRSSRPTVKYGGDSSDTLTASTTKETHVDQEQAARPITQSGVSQEGGALPNKGWKSCFKCVVFEFMRLEEFRRNRNNSLKYRCVKTSLLKIVSWKNTCSLWDFKGGILNLKCLVSRRL